MYTYTSLKASCSSRKYLSGGQRLLVHLHTGNTATEISPVSNPGSHSHWVISGKSNATNTARCNKSVSDKKPSNASAIIIRTPYVIPCAIANCATKHGGCEAPASSTREACKQRPWVNHPEVHAPAVRHIVEDRTRASKVFDPGYQGDGFSCVQSTAVRELDVAVRAAVKRCRCSSDSVGTWRVPDVDTSTWRIAIGTDISRTRGGT